MKRSHSLVITIFALAQLASPPARADLHRFESADSSKSFYAELLRFDDAKKVVTARKVSGKEIHFPLNALSEETQKWVDSQKELLAAGRWLKVNLNGEWGERSIKKGDSSKTITSQRIYSVELSNNGKTPLSDLEVTCDVHLFRDDGKGGSRSVRTEKEMVSYLGAGTDRTVRPAPVTLSSTAPLSTVIITGGGSRSGGGGGG